MLKHFSLALLILCLLLGAAGCSEPVPLPSEAPAIPTTEAALPEATALTMPPVETVPPETSAPTEPQVTEPVPTESPEIPATEAPEDTAETAPAPESTALRQPLRTPPQVSEEPCHFFDDAAFLGDSISYSLMVHHTRTKDFGDALFFVRNSLGVHNALQDIMTVYYQGKEMSPWKALSVSGISKVFIMLGINDIGSYGVDATIESWGLFLEKIQESCPDTQVYIQALTPMWHYGQGEDLTNESIDLYNQKLKELAEANGCQFLDLTEYLKDGYNGLAEVYTSDYYVHMNNEGTAVWANALKEYGFLQEKETP